MFFGYGVVVGVVDCFDGYVDVYLFFFGFVGGNFYVYYIIDSIRDV